MNKDNNTLKYLANIPEQLSAAKLILANKELAFQNVEKEKRAAELIIANIELEFQNQEKEKRAAELIIANQKLSSQNEEKEKRAAELIIANAELQFQNQEKEKRAIELSIANRELKKAEYNLRRLNEEDIRRLNYRLQLATKSADMGIWDWDIVNNRLNWDERMYQLYNIGHEGFESVYEAWASKLHPEDKDQINEEIQLALRDEKKYDTEFRIMDDNQCIHTLRATGTVEWNDIGVPVRMIGINWDITKRKLAAAEREAIISEMSRRNAELEQFGYIISHNLRAPVAIIGASNAMNDPELPSDDRIVYNRAVYQSAMSLDYIIKDLNHILEIKANNHTREVVRFSDLVDDIKMNINDKLITGKFNVTYDFLAIDELFTVKSHLYSIFYNLISNSLKYRRRDNIIGSIEIKSQLLNNKTVLFFTDNGIGFNIEKNKENIFGLYKRFHSDLPGKGMGLFMVKSQVEILGGNITVKSSENVGTNFTIEFPSK